MDSGKFKILCIGAGAIGAYIGGSLSLDGHVVHFLDKPETLDRIRQNGIHLQIPKGKFVIHPEDLWDSMKEALRYSSFDFAVLAIKSYDTESLLENWFGLDNEIPPVVCLQNGIENEEKISHLIGADNTIRGTVTTAIGRIEYGIVVEKLRGIGIETNHELSENIISSFNLAGLNAHGFKNGLEMKWSKLLTNLTTNASCAILKMTPSEIMKNPSLFKIEIGQLREVLSVMKSQKLRVVNLPGTPVRLFSLVVARFPIWLSRIILNQFISKGRGNKMPSFYLDLQSGRRKSEVDYLNGAVVRFGNQQGVSTPINYILNHTLIKMTNGEIDPVKYDHQPERYCKLFS